MTRRTFALISALAGMTALAAIAPAVASADPEAAAASLRSQGYHHIQLDPDYRPGYRAYACKAQAHYRIQMDADANVMETEQVGACSPETGPEEIQVEAPFTDVRVDEDGVHVRAPFVDLKIR